MSNLEFKLKNQFNKTLEDSPALKKRLECVAQGLDLKLGDFLKGFLYYDSNLYDYDNEVYNDYKVRGALYLKYFVEDGYHVQRQRILTQFIKYSGVKSFIDIGYGAPGLYVEDIILKNPAYSLTLVDKFQTAGRFAKVLFSCITNNDYWKKQIILQEYDLDSLITPGKFDAYILFDSIEHAKNPTKSFKTIVNDAPQRAKFILSLPIGPNDDNPVHFIEWATNEDALVWLRGFNLNIQKTESVTPTKADLWSEGDFHNLIILAQKL